MVASAETADGLWTKGFPQALLGLRGLVGGGWDCHLVRAEPPTAPAEGPPMRVEAWIWEAQGGGPSSSWLPTLKRRRVCRLTLCWDPSVCLQATTRHTVHHGTLDWGGGARQPLCVLGPPGDLQVWRLGTEAHERARWLAHGFNQRLRRQGLVDGVHILRRWVLTLEDGRALGVDAGRSRVGAWDWEGQEVQRSPSLSALAHYAFHRTHGEWVLRVTGGYHLCRPRGVLSVCTDVEWVPGGGAAFLEHHRCEALCRNLCLPVLGVSICARPLRLGQFVWQQVRVCRACGHPRHRGGAGDCPTCGEPGPLLPGHATALASAPPCVAHFVGPEGCTEPGTCPRSHDPRWAMDFQRLPYVGWRTPGSLTELEEDAAGRFAVWSMPAPGGWCATGPFFEGDVVLGSAPLVGDARLLNPGTRAGSGAGPSRLSPVLRVVDEGRGEEWTMAGESAVAPRLQGCRSRWAGGGSPGTPPPCRGRRGPPGRGARRWGTFWPSATRTTGWMYGRTASGSSWWTSAAGGPSPSKRPCRPWTGAAASRWTGRWCVGDWGRWWTTRPRAMP